MRPEFSREDFEKLLQDVDDFIKGVATDPSTARLLTENEPFGDLVLFALLDDSVVKSDLWAHLKIISDWIKATEDSYARQFPDNFPKKDGRYDLSERPSGFKSRLDIFKEQVEAWESSRLWTAKVVVNDPLAVIKRMKRGTGKCGERPAQE